MLYNKLYSKINFFKQNIYCYGIKLKNKHNIYPKYYINQTKKIKTINKITPVFLEHSYQERSNPFLL